MSTSRQIVLPEVVRKEGIPEDFGLVVGVAGLSALLHSGYMVFRVVQARKACVPGGVTALEDCTHGIRL
jgi:hypothetical protein